MNYDRRLPPSVVSGFQITAQDERRDQFLEHAAPSAGVERNRRFLNVTVGGAHSDIGDSYPINGLGIRNTNLAVDYLNALSDRPFLQKRAEPDDPQRNVVHRSEQHLSWRPLGVNMASVYTTPTFDANGRRGQNVDLGRQSWGEYLLWDSASNNTKESVDPRLDRQFERRAVPIGPMPADGRRAQTDTSPGFSQEPQTMLASDPGHRGYERYQQAFPGIVASPNIPAGTFSEALLPVVAANTAVTSLKGEGRNEPLPAITSVVFNGDRSALIASSGANGDARLHAALPVDQATRGSLAEASKDLDGLLKREENARVTGSMTAAVDLAENKALSRA